MTNVPAPAPQFPKGYLPNSRARKLFTSNLTPLVVAFIALFSSIYVNYSISARLSSGLCDLLTTVGNPSTVPQTPVGKENVLKFRRSAVVFKCSHTNYAFPDSDFTVKA